MPTLSAPDLPWSTTAAAAAWSLLLVLGTLRITRRRRTNQPRSTVGLFAVLGAVALFLGGLGAWASFSTVADIAGRAPNKGGWGWGDRGWMVPVAIDVAILFFDGWEMIASQLYTADGRRRSARWMRVPPRILVGVTIFLNIQGAESTAGKVSHAAVVSIYVLVVAYARHTIAPPVSDEHEDGSIPWVRWLLRPYPTWCIWQMTKLEKVGWREARDTVAVHLIVRAALKTEHGGRWSWCPVVAWRQVPLDKRALFRAGRVQGLSAEADAVLRRAATAATQVAAGVAGAGKTGVGGVFGAGVNGLGPAGLPVGARVDGGGNDGLAPVGGSLVEAGPWVAAGLCVIERQGLAQEAAANVLKVAEALDGLGAKDASVASQRRLAELAGVSPPTAGKWRDKLAPVFAELESEGAGVAEGEEAGGEVVQFSAAQG